MTRNGLEKIDPNQIRSYFSSLIDIFLAHYMSDSKNRTIHAYLT